ncbi:MAG: hypothetical protein R2745_16340 [Vicinamibacterales bacterium]
MDSTRISIAQLLALDVPLVWQDAVAVAQEVAMLSEVTAAMNPQAALVTPETCFLTRTGEIELPESTEHESPDAVSDVLRLLLAGREAPEALEELAFGHHGRDMSAELAVFPIGNRRAVIAKLATRALARLQEPSATPPAPSAAPSAVRPEPPPLPTGPHLVVPAPDAAVNEPREWGRPVLVPPPPRTEAGPPRPDAAAAQPHTVPPPAEPVAIPPPFRAMPPFRATPSAASAALAGDAPEVTRPSPYPASPEAEPGRPVPGSAASQVATDREVRRLRQRQAERARDARGWSARMRALVGPLGRWLTWRPSVPDPRLIGAAVVVTAAVVTILMRGGPARPGPAPADPDEPTAAVPASPAPSVPESAEGTAPPVTAAGVPALSAATARAAAATATAAAAGSAPPLPARRGGSRPERAAAGGLTPVATPEAPGATAPNDAPGASAEAPPEAESRADSLARPTAPSARPAGTAPARGRPDGGARPGAELGSSPGGDGPLYSADDRDVVPPVMRRQQLPSALLDPAMVPPEDWPILELLIDQRGTVEQVRLHARQPAPGQTLYRHRMLLAAAKAWQFEPALRNGAPVRYVMRVPLEP